MEKGIMLSWHIVSYRIRSLPGQCSKQISSMVIERVLIYRTTKELGNVRIITEGHHASTRTSLGQILWPEKDVLHFAVGFVLSGCVGLCVCAWWLGLLFGLTLASLARQ
jgi:hypothetical protein